MVRAKHVLAMHPKFCRNVSHLKYPFQNSCAHIRVNNNICLISGQGAAKDLRTVVDLKITNLVWEGL